MQIAVENNESYMKENRKNISNVPNLRFPGFEEEWKVKKLGEIAKFSKGKGISKSDIKEDGITECIRYGELYTHYREVISDIKSQTSINITDLVLSEANDVIIPSSGETQIDIATASCVLKSGIALGGDLNIIKTPNNGIFLSYYLNSKKKMEIASLAQGISVVHLYSSQLALLKINLPTLSEQAKIASLLSIIDERIAAQSKIIEGVKELKASLSKQIFSRKLRFKDENGNDFPEWGEKMLGDISTIQSGLSKDQNNLGSGYMVTRIETISNGCVDLDRVGYVNTIDDIKAYKLNIGNILFSNINSVSHIGKTAIINSSMNLYHGMNLLCLKVNNLVNANFLFFVLNSERLRNHFRTICNQAVSQASINQTELSKTNISLPVLQEQEMIVDFFTNIDGKIEVETKTYELLIKQKQYLLRQMFI